MDRFLFTDGMNGVKEVQSLEELQILIESAEQPDKIRIWVFNTNEWITYASFRKKMPLVNKKEKISDVSAATSSSSNVIPEKPKRWAIKIVYAAVAAAGVLLVFNFTKIKWKKEEPLNFSAARPANVPPMDIDSLIYEIETDRGISLDKSTKTNLRLRNTWPERILLQLNADKESSGIGFRYSNVNVLIDNTTGFLIDNAIVKVTSWKNNVATSIDTIRFEGIRFDKVLKRQLNDTYKGDSLSISFESVKAKAFNFCYSASVKNNSGNYNDRWFCRENN